MLSRNIPFILIGVFMALNMFGCGAGPEFGKYSSKDTEIKVTMDYLSGWSFVEERGSVGSYAQVVFSQQVQSKKPVKAIFVLTVKKETKAGLKAATMEAMSDDFLNKRLKLKDAKNLSRQQTQVLGFNSAELVFTYSLPSNPDMLPMKFVPMKERIICFKREDRFFCLRYVNTSDEFEDLEEAFMHCVKSLRFK